MGVWSTAFAVGSILFGAASMAAGAIEELDADNDQDDYDLDDD